MAPTLHIRLGGLGSPSCNASSFNNGMCILTLQVKNLTIGSSGGGGGGSSALKDDEGAMKFIIAVLLVYSLVGTTGMLILRIRKSTTRGNKKVAMKEANHYLKHRDEMSLECHREKRLQETHRALKRLESINCQKSCTESQAFSSSSRDPSSPLLPPSPSTPGTNQSSWYPESQQYHAPIPTFIDPASFSQPLSPSGHPTAVQRLQPESEQHNPWVYSSYAQNVRFSLDQPSALFTAPLLDAASFTLLPLTVAGIPRSDNCFVKAEDGEREVVGESQEVAGNAPGKSLQEQPAGEETGNYLTKGETNTLLPGADTSVRTEEQ